MLHVEMTADAAEPIHTSVDLDDSGMRVSAETLRRLSCDASVVTVLEGHDGAVLDIGRKTRTVPTSIRRALRARDVRCRFPGCAARRCDAHHIEHWADGGATSLGNLMLLCRRHHTLVHEGSLTVEHDALGSLAFVRLDGRVVEAAPPPPSMSVRRLRDAASADALRCGDDTRFDLGYVVDVLRTRPAAS